MNHPTPEEWTPFLYGEVSPETRAQFQAHLDHCPDCQARARSLRKTMSALDSWKLPARAPLSRWRRMRWAAAAAVLLAFGVAVGTLFVSAGLDRLEARHESRLAQLRKDMLSEQAALVEKRTAAGHAEVLKEMKLLFTHWMEQNEASRTEELHALAAALGHLDAKQNQQIARLRTELETVALHTQQSFLQAQNQWLGIVNHAAHEPLSTPDP